MKAKRTRSRKSLVVVQAEVSGPVFTGPRSTTPLSPAPEIQVLAPATQLRFSSLDDGSLLAYQRMQTSLPAPDAESRDVTATALTRVVHAGEAAEPNEPHPHDAGIDLVVRMWPIDKIDVAGAYRKDLGDVGALAASIQAVDLLHPIVIRPQGQLVAGRRRLEACRRLGWTSIPVRLFGTYDPLQAQYDENACRKPLTPSEAVEIGEALEEQEREKAKNRQRAAGGDRKSEQERQEETAPTAEDKTACGNLPQPISDRGKTRERVASAVGLSGKSYVKAKAVVEAAKGDPEQFGDLRRQMDATGKIDPVYRKLKQRQQLQPSAAEAPTKEGNPHQSSRSSPRRGSTAETITLPRDPEAMVEAIIMELDIERASEVRDLLVRRLEEYSSGQKRGTTRKAGSKNKAKVN